MENNKSNNTLLIIATLIIAFMTTICWFQNSTLDNYKKLLEETDTTTIVETDTVYRDTTIVDTVPQYIHQLIVKTDTVYKQEGDSISQIPMVIALKKKKSPTLLK